MKVTIYGMGCTKCHQLYDNANMAIEELGLQCELEKVTDFNKIAAQGIMLTPALAIDGNIVSSGNIPSVEEIKNFII